MAPPRPVSSAEDATHGSWSGTLHPDALSLGNERSDRGRVLIVAPQPFYEDRGTCITTRQVAEALACVGYRIDLLTYPVGRSIELPGTRILRTANPFAFHTVPIGFSIRKLVLDLPLTYALAARLREAPYTAIHAIEEAAFPAVLLGRRYGVPVLYDMQSSLPDQMRTHRLFRTALAQRLLRGCERWLLEEADLVIASAGLAARALRAAPGARIREWRFASQQPPVPPEAVDALRRSLGIPAGARIVVYSGTFEPYQGLGELLSAIPLVARDVPGTVFVLVGGNGAHIEALSHQAARLGLNGSLRLVQRQPREAAARFLALADVLVSTRSYGENAPLKIFDYLAAGKPIVASNVACHRSVLGEDRAIVVAHTPGDLARALTLTLQDSRLAARLSAGAQRYAEAHLHDGAFIQLVGGLFDELRAAAPPRVGR
jgi:glycosyltransferase involved in cell wall biosynthesis